MAAGSFLIRAPVTADDQESPSPTVSDYDSSATTSDPGDYDYDDRRHGFAAAGSPDFPPSAVPVAKITADEDDDAFDASEDDGGSGSRSPVARAVLFDPEVEITPVSGGFGLFDAVDGVSSSGVVEAKEDWGDVATYDRFLNPEAAVYTSENGSGEFKPMAEHGLVVDDIKTGIMDLAAVLEPAVSGLSDSAPSSSMSGSDAGKYCYENLDTSSDLGSVYSVDSGRREVDHAGEGFGLNSNNFAAKDSRFVIQSADYDSESKMVINGKAERLMSGEIGVKLAMPVNDKHLAYEIEDIASCSNKDSIVFTRSGSDSDAEVGSEEISSVYGVLAGALHSADGEPSLRHESDVSSNSKTGTSVAPPNDLGYAGASLKPSPPFRASIQKLHRSRSSVAMKPEADMREFKLKIVQYFHLLHRLRRPLEHEFAAKVLHCLSVAEGSWHTKHSHWIHNIGSPWENVLQLDADRKYPLDFSCNVLVLGETGVGKSATINSLFGERKTQISAFDSETHPIIEIAGTVDGINLCVIDTPGLRASALDQHYNRKVLSSVRKHMKKCPPDVLLYVDRIDIQRKDHSDAFLLRSITAILGSSIWSNSIVVLTHAAGEPPEGTSGIPLSYGTFISSRSNAVRKAIQLANMNDGFYNPVALVENHSMCRKNQEGERVLPNGLEWRPELLLCCCSMKMLFETMTSLRTKQQLPFEKLSHTHRSFPVLSYFLNSLSKPKLHLGLHGRQGVEDQRDDADLGELSCYDYHSHEVEYDELPPFRPLTKAEIAELSKVQQQEYYSEYEYGIKLFQKKQLKEELCRAKELEKSWEDKDDSVHCGVVPTDDTDEYDRPESRPSQLFELALPISFDCDNPNYLYHYMVSNSRLRVQPFLDPYGWDHDFGLDTILLENRSAVAGRFPAAGRVQFSKDKKKYIMHMDSSISAKYSKSGSALANINGQTFGNEIASTRCGAIKFPQLKKNRVVGGMSMTSFDGTKLYGVKLEDKISTGNIFTALSIVGAICTKGATMFGTCMQVRMQDDYLIPQFLITLGLTLFKCRNDFALSGNLQSQFPVGKNNITVGVRLNNELDGQISMKTRTAQQLHIAAIGALPIILGLFKSFSGYKNSSDL